MRTVKAPEIRSQEILEGALAVFLEKGYEKTTISDIARALGISQGLCYRYFPSKEAIYEAVLDRCAARIAGENLQNRPQDQPIRQWIEEIPQRIHAMLCAEREQPQLCALVHNPQNAKMHRELCEKVAERLLPAVTQVLEQAVAAGELRLTDCRSTAIFGLWGEIGLLLALEDPGDAIREHWKLLLGLT